MKLLDQIATRQLIVVTGKGGVGKTTIAAALGRRLAAMGRRVLLLEVDPRESLHQLLGTEPSGGQVVKAGQRLAAQNLLTRDVVDGLIRETLPIAALARKVIGSPVFQHFAEGAPGLKEMAVLGYALRTVEGKYRHKADLVVLDAPATGHSATMLAAPLVLADAIGGGQLGDMATELAALVADPRRCSVVLTALAEEMPIQEALELVELLRDKIGRPPEVVVANALYPPVPSRSAGKPTGAAAAATLDLWRQRRAVNEHELARLRSGWKGPLAEIPLLPLDRGPDLLSAVESVLGQELG